MPNGADILAEQSRAASNYHYSIRTAVRGLWTGALLYMQFIDSMMSTTRAGLTWAYAEGAAACGITPAEYTFEEKIALEQAIVREQNYIGQFADAIEKGSKANGGKLEPFMTRAKMWMNRYNDLVNRAKVTACANRKLLWRLGATEEHCRDCARYDGRIHRGSTWARYEIRPQSPKLACHGFNCLCTLEPTDERALPGRPPGMTG